MNWLIATKLHQIYLYGSTNYTTQFVNDGTIRHLICTTGELCINGKNVVIDEYEKLSFDAYYESEYLPKYLKYSTLLERYGLLTDKNGKKKVQARFEEEELKVLSELDEQMQSGYISEIRQQIIEREESIRGVSRMFFFNNEKYLDDRADVVEALKKILNIQQLANDKAEQWIYKLTHPQRKLIVLCENLDSLRRPTRPRKNYVELWYAGGWNTPKLDFELERIDVPIYYACDWDQDGIDIYRDVKNRLPMIKLLTPLASPIKLSDSPNHHSHWNNTMFERILEMEKIGLLDKKHRNLINQLIVEESWIREEDNGDIIDLLTSNNAIEIS
jgi:hypothetical protein